MTPNPKFSELPSTHQATLASALFTMNALAAMVVQIADREEIPSFLKGMTLEGLIDNFNSIYAEDVKAGQAPHPFAICASLDEQIGLVKAQGGGKKIGSVARCVVPNPNNN